MKKIGLIFLFAAAVYVSKAQGSSQDRQAIQMLGEFYRAYNRVWSTSANQNVLLKKLDSLQRIYFTKRMISEINSSGLDEDPLVGTSYTDVEHLKTLEITRDPQRENAYIVSYIAHVTSNPDEPFDEKVVIHVTVEEEDSRLKIASVL